LKMDWRFSAGRNIISVRRHIVAAKEPDLREGLFYLRIVCSYGGRRTPKSAGESAARGSKAVHGGYVFSMVIFNRRLTIR